MEIDEAWSGDFVEVEALAAGNRTRWVTSNQPNCRGCTKYQNVVRRKHPGTWTGRSATSGTVQEEVSQDRLPKFKSKKNGVGGFRPTGTIKVTEKGVQLPRLGVLKLKERGYLRPTPRYRQRRSQNGQDGGS